MMKNKLVFILIILAVVGFLFLPIIGIPWGGAEDTNGDGRVDKFWDGTKYINTIQYLQIKF